MSGLNRQDIEILSHYAERGNRELYWNYLAQKQGNDGYGLLALGVVRNDNVPGQVANSYAQSYAREHNGVTMSERRWESFGDDLVRADLAARERQMAANRPDLALNLPVRDVQHAHDVTFNRYGIDPNAWTPRLLLDASRRHGGEREAERLWDGMLDNGFWGIGRGFGTIGNAAIRYNDARFDASSYMSDVFAARSESTTSRPNTNPDLIGDRNSYYMYSRTDRTWTHVTGPAMDRPSYRVVTEPGKLAELNDIRAVRLERLQTRDDFHPDDPNRNRPIMRSPLTVAENEVTPPSSDPRTPNAHGYAMYRQIEQGVERLSAGAGGVSGETNARMTMSLYALATERGMTSVDHLVLNRQGSEHPAGSLVVLVQGQDASNPANRLAHMNASEAAGRPVEQSLQLVQGIEQQQTLLANRAQMQDPTLLAARETSTRAM